MYLDKISQISVKRKYLKWYCGIITNALKRAQTRKHALELLGYVEGHHILPKCMSTKFERADKDNLVYLSSREHILIHWLMVKMFENTNYHKKSLSMLGAFLRVTKTQSPRRASYIYRTSLLGDCISKANKGRVSWNKGKKFSIETKLKMSRSRKGKIPLNYDQFIRHAEGKIYVNNGVVECRVYPNSIPDGYSKGPLRITCPLCLYSADSRNFKRYHKACHSQGKEIHVSVGISYVNK